MKARRYRRRLEQGHTLNESQAKWLAWYTETFRGEPVSRARERELEVDAETNALEGLDVEPSDEPIEEPYLRQEPEPVAMREPPQPPQPPRPAMRSTRADIVDDALRSAVNAQVASLEMMERVCAAYERLANVTTSRLAATEEQLVDALTMLAERVVEERVEVQQIAAAQQQSAQGSASINDAVQAKLVERLLGGSNGAAHTPDVNTPKA
jgi:hypothetical protein